MFKKRFIILLILLMVAIGTISAASAEDANATEVSQVPLEEIGSEDTITDDNLESSSDDILSRTITVTGNTFDDIENAIKNANDGDTVVLSGNYAGANKDIKIKKAISIVGDGNTNIGDSLILHVDVDNVKISKLNFIGSYIACEWNYDVGRNAGNLECTDCNFIGEGSALFADGRAINCNFINKTRHVIYGGMSTINCNFINNHLDSFCHVIDYGTGNSNVECINCTFINNSAEMGIINSLLDDFDILIADCRFIDNSGDSAIYYSGDAGINVINCTFIRNIGTHGAAIYCYGNDQIYAVNCTFINNTAERGGALYQASAINSLFIGNSAEDEGVMYNGDAEYCTFIDNTVRNGEIIAGYGDIKYCTFKGNPKPSTEDHIIYSRGKITLTQTGNYYGKARLKVKLIDPDSNVPLPDEEVKIRFPNGEEYSLYMNSNGEDVCDLPFIAESYTVTAEATGNYVSADKAGLKVDIEKYPSSLKMTKAGSYYGETSLSLKFIDLTTNNPISGEYVKILFSNGQKAVLVTDKNGEASYTLPFAPGTYSATATVLDDGYSASPVILNSIKIDKAPATLVPTKLSTTYASGKYFQTKLINSKTKKAISGIELTLKVYTGKKYKIVTVKTGSNGIAKYSTSNLEIGTHKIVVSIKDTKYASASAKTSSVKITKANYEISAPAVTNPYNQEGTFKIVVKNKASGKVVKGVKLSVKVYTGKKYKTYSVTTNSKGEASISTKTLSKTTHKVSISTKATGKYNAASKSSSIKIVKAKIPTHFICNSFNYEYYANGALHGVKVNLDLYDANGKILHKTITGQIYRTYLSENEPYGDPVSGTSGSTLFVTKYTGAWDFYVKITFEGDSTYEGCTYLKNI